MRRRGNEGIKGTKAAFCFDLAFIWGVVNKAAFVLEALQVKGLQKSNRLMNEAHTAPTTLYCRYDSGCS